MAERNRGAKLKPVVKTAQEAKRMLREVGVPEKTQVRGTTERARAERKIRRRRMIRRGITGRQAGRT